MVQLHTEICYKQVVPKPSSGQMDYLIAAAGNPGLYLGRINNLNLYFAIATLNSD